MAYSAARGREIAYPAALVLSVLTLLVSLTQSEHYSLFEAGVTLASSTFLVGSVLQIGVIVYVLSYLFLKRVPSEQPGGLG